jgi:tRNA (mo5U34)-methyltransferase
MSDPDPFDHVRDLAARRESQGWWHSFDLPDGSHIEGVNPVGHLRERIERFPIPADLRGKRALDIGTWDGWFAFEMERRGAEVLAVDVWDNPRFHEVHALLDSRVEHRLIDVYDLSPAKVGRFDVVLFMGVLYHLKHPLLALERVCSVTEGIAAVDSFVLQERHRPGSDVEDRPIMEFFEAAEFGGQTDNWVAPTVPCLLAFCRTAGFARVELRDVLPSGAFVTCHRRWDPEIDRRQPVPRLRAAFHHTAFGINFSSDRDEYVTCVFDHPEQELGLDDVQPEVGGFGTRPIHVGRVAESTWQANFKLPPGLAPGWHAVRVRVRNGAPSDAIDVAVDLPPPDGPVAITTVKDGTTWRPDELALGSGNVLSLWVEGLPKNADRANVGVFLGGRRLTVAFVSPPDPEGRPRQVNAEVPGDVGAREAELVIRLGTHTSDPARVRIVG